MSRFRGLSFVALFGCPLIPGQANAHVLSFSGSDFATSIIFSNVTTFDFYVQGAAPLVAGGSYRDPGILDIQYSVSGSLGTTPSGFTAFGFRLDHLFSSSSPPITGTDFHALNPDASVGNTLSFDISPTANLADGLQVSELLEIPSDQFGNGVVFQFNR